MLAREHYLKALRLALSRNPVAALIGPRQCGKTTLARELLKDEVDTHY
jgi:predicted AAA+ superfamily ATPase